MPMDTEKLNSDFGIEGKAYFDRGRGGLPRLTLRGAGTAEVYLHGAHVTSFRHGDEPPLLRMSAQSNFAPGLPIRGGIPVCFPWFGAHPDNEELPIHGLARLMEWEVSGIDDTGNGTVSASFSLESTPWTRKRWPADFRLEYTVTVGEELDVRLEVLNRQKQAFDFTCAFHPYFAVSDIRNVRVTGLEGVGYRSKVIGSDELFTEDGPIELAGETDRTYLDTTSDCEIIDPGMNRWIRISKSGSRSTVVWNPWVDKAERMEDFGDEEWTGMICVETANARGNEVHLEPGGSHTMRATYRTVPM